MDKNKICEALYASSGDVVIRRRKSPYISVALFAAGTFAMILNELYATEMSNNLQSAVVFIGGVIALTGLILLASRLFGNDGAPYHLKEQCFLRYEELYFDHNELAQVVSDVNNGAIELLLNSKHTNIPSVAVALYRTTDNRFVAMQAFEYADFEYRPLTDLRVVRRE